MPGGLGDFLETGHGDSSKARPPDTFGGAVPSTGTTCPRRLEAAALVPDRAGSSLTFSGPSCSRGPLLTAPGDSHPKDTGCGRTGEAYARIYCDAQECPSYSLCPGMNTS